MFSGTSPIVTNKAEFYQGLRLQLISLLAGEADSIANAAALLYHSMPDVNWVGFYFLKGSDLVLGPFQGKPACVRIPLGKGVCGTAGERVPLIKHGAVWGVLDLDSPVLGRFDQADRAGCESLAAIYLDSFKE